MHALHGMMKLTSKQITVKKNNSIGTLMCQHTEKERNAQSNTHKQKR